MPIASTPRTCPMTLLSSLSSCASGVYSIKLVDLLLAAHPQVTGREVDFTLLVIDAVIYQSDRPYAALPADLIRKAAHSPDLVRALVSTPDAELSSDAGDIELAFERLVRLVMLQYCHLDRAFTPSSHLQAVEYLTQCPKELMVKHAQYRSEMVRMEQAAKATARVEARQRRIRSGLVASMSMLKFKSKKQQIVAK
ncbi:hypothetical protein RhiJN_02269 [Ceratobasidium sp. AG-Ba]|nr:hypothetical protein RhiJN_02269 [Ceratobasidium sp. AG-Ba]